MARSANVICCSIMNTIELCATRTVGAHQEERVGCPGDGGTQVGLGAVGVPPLHERLATAEADILAIRCYR